VTLASFLWHCVTCYFRARRESKGVSYFAVLEHGVPQVTVMIAHGREAWQVSEFASGYFGSIATLESTK
jgi:hypothetical protein